MGSGDTRELDLQTLAAAAAGERSKGQREAASQRLDRRARAHHARWHARRGAPQPKLPLVLDKSRAHPRMVSQRDSRCASRTDQTRPSYSRRTLRWDWPRRSPVPHLLREWSPPPHLCRMPFRRPYAGVSYLSTSRTPPVAIRTTSADASGPSFTPSST